MNRKSLLALMTALSLSAAIGLAAPKAQARAAASPASPVPAAIVAAAPTGAAGSAPATAAAAAGTTGVTSALERSRGVGTYITLFIFLLLSGLGLPLPEEVPLLLAGYLASHQTANFWIVIVVGLAGALASDMLLFMATHRWRSHIFRWRWMRATIRPRHLVIARRQFHNHGLKIVIVARWLPALRSAICLTAGLTGISFWRFMLVDATAACITVSTSVMLGYYAGAHIGRLISGFKRAEHIVLMILIVAAVVAVLVRFLWWRTTTSAGKLAKPLPPQDGQSPIEGDVPGEAAPSEGVRP